MNRFVLLAATVLAPATAQGATGDLIAPLSSQSFSAISTRGTATANGDTTSGSTSTPTATIKWDATAKAWTLTTGGGSITFTNADIDATNSQGAATVYLRTNGSTSDSLTVTKAGTSGRLTFRYVGSAFWQHTTINGSSGSGALDALVYGFGTPTSAVPVTGTAAYAVDLVGAETIPAGVGPMAGQGTALLDFSAGTITMNGTVDAPYWDTSNWSASGKLTSGANGFSGTFTWDDSGSFTGSFKGQLFGPSGQEIGAAFSGKAADGRIGVGTITGRKGAVGNRDFLTQPLPNPQMFNTTESVVTFTSRYGPLNNDTAGNFSAQALAKGALTISYSPSGGYQLSGTIAPGYTDLIESARPNRTYVAEGYTLNHKSGSSQYRLSHYVYGMDTPVAAVPRTGKAGYAVTFSGHAVDADYRNTMRIGGNGAVIVNFATGAMTLSGDLDYGEDWIMAGRAAQSATGRIRGTATLAANANAFAGSLTLTGLGTYNGRWWGAFYGPKAQEIGAAFNGAESLTGNRLSGTLSGLSDPTLVQTLPRLRDITTQTTFNTVAATPGDLTVDTGQWTWHPATGTYDVPGYTGAIVTAGMIDATRTNAARTWYHLDNSTRYVDGYIWKATPDNPAIALSYTSFADLLSGPKDIYAGPPTHRFTVFGVQTPTSQIPRSGQGTWQGIARGYGNYPSLNWKGAVAGKSTLVADFGMNTSQLTLALRTVENTPRALAPLVLEGLVSTGANSFIGNGYQGYFFGPNMAEFGAAWSVYFYDAGYVSLAGAAVGKRTQ